jgi:hypothetical protein
VADLISGHRSPRREEEREEIQDPFDDLLHVASVNRAGGDRKESGSGRIG